jgi:hypothetical protein
MHWVGFTLAFTAINFVVRRFHVIQKTEGRNDPFSAMMTFLKEAPRIVVVDFGCSFEVS